MSATCAIQFGLGGLFSAVVLGLSPIGFWKLNEAVGAVAYDSSGNDRDGVYVNEPTLGAHGITPEGIATVALNGSDEKITVASTALNLTAGPLSVMALVKKPAASAEAGIAGTGAVNGYDMTWQLATHARFRIAGIFAEAAYSTTGWHLFVGTWDGTTGVNGIKLYIDGTLVAQETAGTTTLSAAGFQIGASTTYYNGSLGCIAVFTTELSQANVTVLQNAVSWTDVTADVLNGIKLNYGINGAGPTTRVASSGTLRFDLNNSASNSAGQLGYYSLLHANKRAGFDLNIPVRLSITNGGTTYYKFRGRLVECVPVPGQYRDRITKCIALDWMDEASQLKVSGLDVVTNKRSDELVGLLLNEITDRPAAYTIETGLENYQYAFDSTEEESTSNLEELHRIAMSELGYAYIKGDTEAGGRFVFESRSHRPVNPSVQVTLSNIQTNVVVPGSRDDIVQKVQVTVHPTSIDADATTVLFALQTTQTLVRAGSTNNSIFGPYRDPNNPGTRIGGIEQIQPVSTTDYMMNTLPDGSGTNLTANFTVTATFTGNGVRFTITNTGSQDGFVTKLQVRGKGVYRFAAVIEEIVDNAYGQRALVVDMPYQNSVNTGESVASYWAETYSQALAHARSVSFFGNSSATLMTHALAREIGDRIALTETVTGLNGTEFTINGVGLDIFGRSSDLQIKATWILEPASTIDFWILGTAGASELGTTSTLGF